MVISVALFGFAASGIFVNIVAARKKDWETHLPSQSFLDTIIIFYSITAILSFIVLNQLPFDYFRLPLESIQVFYLLIVYLLLSLPFFFTGLAVTLAYAYSPEKSGLIYFSSMSGSACGAVIPFLFLPLLGEGHLILLVSLIPLLLAPFTIISSKEESASPGRVVRKRPTQTPVVDTIQNSMHTLPRPVKRTMLARKLFPYADPPSPRQFDPCEQQELAKPICSKMLIMSLETILTARHQCA